MEIDSQEGCMFRVLFVILLLLLTACSSLYHPQQGWVPEGYHENQLDDRHYQIQFQTYRSEDWGVLQACMLYRAAQLGRENQFMGFTLRNVQQSEKYDVNAGSPATGASTSVGVSGGFMGTDNKPVYGAVAPVYVMEYKIRTVSADVDYSPMDIYEYRVADVTAGSCPQ
jgi:hypothetical protein